MPEIVHDTISGPLTFGPVFDKDFLQDVYNLQLEIQGLGKDGNGSVLENICIAPLRSEYSSSEINVSDCVVQSIWGYFGSDMDSFNETYEEDGFEVCLLYI